MLFRNTRSTTDLSQTIWPLQQVGHSKWRAADLTR